MFWLQAFAAPLFVFGLLSFIVYPKGEHNKGFAIVLIFLGAMTGTILAEWIRRKYVLETFFSRIYGSPDLDDPGKKER